MTRQELLDSFNMMLREHYAIEEMRLQLQLSAAYYPALLETVQMLLAVLDEEMMDYEASL